VHAVDAHGDAAVLGRHGGSAGLQLPSSLCVSLRLVSGTV
jgi:hypothetical protein